MEEILYNFWRQGRKQAVNKNGGFHLGNGKIKCKCGELAVKA